MVCRSSKVDHWQPALSKNQTGTVPVDCSQDDTEPLLPVDVHESCTCCSHDGGFLAACSTGELNSPPQSAASWVLVTLFDAATSTSIFCVRRRSRGVTARLSAEPPSAKGRFLAVKLSGLQYLVMTRTRQQVPSGVSCNHRKSLYR